jgi:hypothetical protein
MTVAELIEQLQQFQPDTLVEIQFNCFCADEGSYTMSEDVDCVVMHSDQQIPIVTIIAD